MKLSQDQNEALLELLELSDGVSALMFVVENLVREQERDLLSLPLSKDTEQELIYRKGRAEGARKLYVSLLLALKLKK